MIMSLQPSPGKGGKLGSSRLLWGVWTTSNALFMIMLGNELEFSGGCRFPGHRKKEVFLDNG